MKWFKHFSDAHTNLKHQQVIVEHGMEGYGFWWMCVELVAQQGKSSRIKADKKWVKALEYRAKLPEKKLQEFLQFFAQQKLISGKSLENGDLYIPKFAEYGDEYSQKVRRVSGHSRDNVGLDKKRLDKNRLEEKPHASISFLENIPTQDLQALSNKYRISERGIKSKAEDLKLYCEQKGRSYKNYRAFLENAIKKDQVKLRTEYQLPRVVTRVEDEAGKISPEKWEELKAGSKAINEKMRV